ncbi:hypothetical protein J6590_098124 [Homalodisca vitripennis]|nr:hypothetical protein J6590_098124 [Homalodisca vitripennis]
MEKCISNVKKGRSDNNPFLTQWIKYSKRSTRVFVSTACSRTLWRDVTAHQSYGAECCARIDVATKSSVGTEVLKDKILRILVGDQDIFLTKFLVGGLDVKPGPEILRGGTTLMDCHSKIPCRRSRCQALT